MADGNEFQLNPTPLLDDLESGPWPSFIKGFKEQFKKTGNTMIRGALDQLNYSYQTKMGYWKGGVVGVHGYGAGIISRYSMVSDLFPEAKEFHTVRIQPAPGLHYSSKSLREICDIWEKYGSGLINCHGQSGNLQLIGIEADKVQAAFDEFNQKGWDLGGAGACVRTAASCVGPARCEMSCYDTLNVHHKMLTYFTDLVHRPALPYKAKFKFSGCPNDCTNAIQRADYAVIGTWKGDIQVDEAEVKAFIDSKGMDYVVNNVVTRCPTNAITMESGSIKINNDDCVRCMHCINVMTKALSPGKERGVSLLCGGKGILKVGNMLGAMMIPFIKVDTEEEQEAFVELIEQILDFWADNALDHERLGEFIERIGMHAFLEGAELDTSIDMVTHPRDNPYFKAGYDHDPLKEISL
ncbi:MAG: dissimilatory-type sulfite reductase subunit alpha [Magnetococcales bacterium]|nr:dissimilatory-type sulfite reductase subunit alpha [Magnetococcales bacterium]